MHTRKWLSNLQKVLQKILEVDRAVKVDFYMRNLPSEKTLDILWLAREVDRAVKVDFYMRNLPSEKTLDILWLAREDLRVKSESEPFGGGVPLNQAKLLAEDSHAV